MCLCATRPTLCHSHLHSAALPLLVAVEYRMEDEIILKVTAFLINIHNLLTFLRTTSSAAGLHSIELHMHHQHVYTAVETSQRRKLSPYAPS